MPISRAITQKRLRPQISAPMPQRSVTIRPFAPGSIRAKISAPVELLSTTNILSYNAPDIYPQTSASSQSGDDSDSLPALSVSTTSTTESSSAASSPPSSPEPNHLSCYFNRSQSHSTSAEDAPLIPQRSSSHTKKSHEMLHRKRSITRTSGRSGTGSFVKESAMMFNSKVEISSVPEPHPFGNELAQVTELAEEYGVQVLGHSQVAVIDEEELDLISKGLFKFAAEDYMLEIEGFFADAFGDPEPVRAMWI